MNLFSFIPFFGSKPIPRQVLSESWDQREGILQDDVNLFCWKRPIDPEVDKFLDLLVAGPALKIQQNVSLESIDDDMLAFEKGLENYVGHSAAFVEDVKMLAGDFLNYSPEGQGTLHLRLVENNACTKFHLDGYNLRLFTTYRGRGTEWLPEKAVNRNGLGRSNHDIVKDPESVRNMVSFEVAILKGEIPNKINKTKGIVHRSPAIAGTGEKRVILRIDI